MKLRRLKFMALRSKKKNSAFSNMDDLKVAEEEKSLEIEKDISVKPEPEEDLNTKPEGKPEAKITRRRNIKGTVNNLSLRLNTEDLMAVKFLSLKSKKSIQSLLIEGLNLLIQDELERSPEDIRYLHKIL
ncbi:MAG: hypothetical protein LBG48_02335 [Rickettsiales bacterium]|jgi:hypothetical protein|nr:hypothetical protein [Rickettsiales bacterium]